MRQTRTGRGVSERCGAAWPARFAVRDRGFALIIVLWTLILIAFVVAHLSATGKTEIRIASNLTVNAVAGAAADGAIFAAIYNQSNPNPDQRWPVDGNARALAIGNARVAVRLEDEAWRVNPNFAAPVLLEALLQLVGNDPESAHRLATAITEWVGSAAEARPQAAIIADYRAAGLDYAPPGAPLETLDELGRVIGMKPAILAALRPHLTLYGPPQPSAATTDPIVAAAIARTITATPAPLAGQPPPDVVVTRIIANASGPGSARVSRSAVVRLGAALPQGYEVLAWGDNL